MSDWFDNQDMQNTPTPEQLTAEPDTSAATSEAAPSEPVSSEPTAPAEPTGWTQWQQPVIPPVAPTMQPPAQPTVEPPVPPVQAAEPTSQPVQPPVESPVQQPIQQPPLNTWQPAPNPYGWSTQPPVQPPKPPKKKSHGAAILIAVLAVLCVGSLALSIVLLAGQTPALNNPSSNSTTDRGSSTQPTVNQNAPTVQTKEPAEEGLTTTEIVKKNLDSTVVITMYTRTTSSGFFGTASTNTGSEKSAGVASGIIWTEDGYIITNAHCVYSDDLKSTYSRIAVTLYDGTEFERAEIVGYDTTTDLAVIKVDVGDKKLSPAEFGNSDELQLGDRVVVLGNNSGLGWSVTQGCISGLARDVYEETSYAIKCLQTDAVINPGNSGGPLLNSSGQVVGINSAKIVASGYEGLGFSIPIKEASEIIENLVTYGYVKGRIMLGISGYTYNQYPGYEGFLIESISDKGSLGGTAAQAGDIITEVDGVRITSYAEMRKELTKHQVGDTVTLTLLRVERGSRTPTTFTIDVTLIESDGSV